MAKTAEQTLHEMIGVMVAQIATLSAALEAERDAHAAALAALATHASAKQE